MFLKDIWPTRDEIQAVERQYVIPGMFKEVYQKIEVRSLPTLLLSISGKVLLSAISADLEANGVQTMESNIYLFREPGKWFSVIFTNPIPQNVPRLGQVGSTFKKKVLRLCVIPGQLSTTLHFLRAPGCCINCA